MHRTLIGAVLAAVVSMPPAVAVAQSAAPAAPTAGSASSATAQARAKVRAACAGDVQKFCPNVERGKGGGLRECMKANEPQLSPECKSARDERAAARAKEKS